MIRFLGLGFNGFSLFGLLLSSGSVGSRVSLGFLRGWFVTGILGRGPESEVVTEQLHDQGAITVALFGEGVELCNRVIECLLSKVACTIGGVEDLVVEDGEVQGKTQANGVSGSEVGLGNIGGALSSG